MEPEQWLQRHPKAGSSWPIWPKAAQIFWQLFLKTSARYRAAELEQWLQRHTEAGSSWPSWPKAAQIFRPLLASELGGDKKHVARPQIFARLSNEHLSFIHIGPFTR